MAGLFRVWGALPNLTVGILELLKHTGGVVGLNPKP